MRLLRSDPSDTARDKAVRAVIWIAILLAVALLSAVAGPWFAGVTAGHPG